ncbi:LPS export ABC transporter periplasmic protein LptC [Candidatus Enterovibrio escicola]|uniref:LPS export ABC transporter periplasmic protein LptC n=1 Tax=Candidatus Enterovibrio escicola TaxID=1927127 RepID=UPI001237B80B|nr:LPS export ABC transporter periplasmic protein LptC [Candidatus Enterovibrio escacola]
MILRHLGRIALLVICGFTGHYLLSQYHLESETKVKLDAEEPLFTADNIKSTRYNEHGMRSYTLNSIHVKHYQKLDETHFHKPTLWTYNDSTVEEWRIHSDFAVLDSSNYLNMTGHVRIFNLLPNARMAIIKVDKLTLNLTTRDFWSETETEITGVGFQIRGQRAKGNFISHQMELTDQVKSKYAPDIE